MTPLNLAVTVLGRPLKPVALGLAVLCGTLVWSNLADVGQFGSDAWGDAVAALSAVAVALFMAGWWGWSQRIAEAALLVTSAVMTFRALALLLEVGPLEQSVYLSVGVAVIATGSYVLERADPRVRGGG